MISGQQAIIASLLDPGRYPHAAKSVRRIETHISWVLLAGRYAYKIKKAVHPDFLDFTTLEARLHFCMEELRLNKRLAPDLYLEVMPIGGTPENPILGALPAIEYAVRMRRFAARNRLDRLAAKGKLEAAHIDALARKIAKFHLEIPSAPAGERYGLDMPKTMHLAFHELRERLGEEVSELEQEIAQEYSKIEPLVKERVEAGYVRECHGDLHLGNIALIGGDPVPFDCLEFDPKLRWTDPVNEIAFPFMDLVHSGKEELAWRFLNAYLEITGDYAGLPLLRYFASCRATVRGMVDAIRASQSGADFEPCRKHLALASRLLRREMPRLFITHGLPGSGKTTWAVQAAARERAIRIRSDVERKRLHDIAPEARTRSGIDSGIYSESSTREVYAFLLHKAANLLDAGFSVIVDASFPQRKQRDEFRGLAEARGLSFSIASMHADYETLKRRICERRNDASEADLSVLERMMQRFEPVSKLENPST